MIRVEEFLAAVVPVRGGCGGVESARLRTAVMSRTTASVKRPMAVGTGLRLISAGNVVPFLRRPVSRAPAPICRWFLGPAGRRPDDRGGRPAAGAGIRR